MDNQPEIIVELCMGSACFARGNNRTADMLKTFVDDHDLGDRVLIRGALCQGECGKGPVVKINDIAYHDPEPGQLVAILREMTGGC